MLEFSSTNNDCGCDSGSLNQFTDPSCPAPSVVTWNSIQGKPSCFIPCAHTHTPEQIINLNSYINSVIFADSLTTTNSIQLTAPSGVLNANLRLSANAGTGYKVPLSILSDGLIGQIPYATGSNAGILSTANWITFNNKFNTPSGTTSQYVRGDGSLASFPVIPSGTVTSVGLSMPAAFTVANSPVTGSGTLTVTGAGTAAQYIRGNGTLATFPITPTFLVGSVPFGNGTGLTESNTKFYWDSTFNSLLIGTNSYINSGEQLYIYDAITPKIKLQGTQSSRISLNSTSLTTRNVDLFVGSIGAYLQTSNNIPLVLVSNTSSITLNNDGVSSTSGGIATANTYINVDSRTVNVAKTDNCLFINVNVITGISSVDPLTIIMPNAPYDGQEITIVIMSDAGLIYLSSGEILVQGFGGTSNVIGHLPDTTGNLNYGTSGMKYKYLSNTSKWYRIY